MDRKKIGLTTVQNSILMRGTSAWILRQNNYSEDIERKLWDMLIFGITRYQFTNVDNQYHKYLGTKSYQFLDKEIKGSDSTRNGEVDRKLREICYKWGDYPQTYVNDLLNLFSEAERLGIFTYG